MSPATLKSRRSPATTRQQVVRALLPGRMARDLREYAATKGWSTEETAGLVLADFVLTLRRERARLRDHAAVIRRLETAGCAFVGPVERQHRFLARRLEAIDAGLAS